MNIELVFGLELEATKVEIIKTDSKFIFITLFNDYPYHVSIKPGMILKCKYEDKELCHNFQVSDMWNIESENKLVLCGEEI